MMAVLLFLLSPIISALLLSPDSPHLTLTPRRPSAILSDLTPLSTDAVNMSGILGNASLTPVLDDGSSLFWWFITRIGGDALTDTAPVVVWLQGGPGCSSVIGAFFEFGPQCVTDTLELTPRPDSWATKYHLLLIDSPFGAGYSFTTDPRNYARNEYDVGRYVYLLLQKLAVSHPEFFAQHDWYLFGQSYGGKYVPAVAYFILNWNGNTTLTHNAYIPLKGIGVGDGITDPLRQLTTFSAYAFAASLIDERERATVEKYERGIVELLGQGQWVAAWNATNAIISLLMNQSGNMNVYNFRSVGQYNFTPIQTYFNQSRVKAILNVPESAPFAVCDQSAYSALETDIMQSLVWMMPYLLNRTRVLMYNGQDDTFLNNIGFENWIAAIPWDGQTSFQRAPKAVWYANGSIAGYAKSYANLTQLNVLKAGHMVPRDQLQNSLDMLTRFITKSPWNS